MISWAPSGVSLSTEPGGTSKHYWVWLYPPLQQNKQKRFSESLSQSFGSYKKLDPARAGTIQGHPVNQLSWQPMQRISSVWEMRCKGCVSKERHAEKSLRGEWLKRPELGWVLLCFHLILIWSTPGLNSWLSAQLSLWQVHGMICSVGDQSIAGHIQANCLTFFSISLAKDTSFVLIFPNGMTIRRAVLTAHFSLSFFFWGQPSHTQSLLLVLCSGITPGELGGPDGIRGIKPLSVMCMANTQTFVL